MENNKVYLSFDMNGNFLSYDEKSSKIFSGSVASVEYYVNFTENLASNDLVYISFVRTDNQKVEPLICERISDCKFRLLSTGKELDVGLDSVEEMTINVIIKNRDVLTNLSKIKTQSSVHVNVYPGTDYSPGLVEDSMLANFEEHLNNIELGTIRMYDWMEAQWGDTITFEFDGIKEAPAIYKNHKHTVQDYDWETGSYKTTYMKEGFLLVFNKKYTTNEDKNLHIDQLEYFFTGDDIYVRTLFLIEPPKTRNFTVGDPFSNTTFRSVYDSNNSLKNKILSLFEKININTNNFKNYYDKTETYCKTEIDASINAINTALEGKQAVGDYATNTQVDNKISLAISSVTDNAPEAFDTLKEIADWIHEDEQGTSALINRVGVVEGKCINLQSQISENQSNIDSNSSQIVNINSQISNITNNISEIEDKNVEQDSKLSLAVLTSQQVLTEAQKSQVRQNIGASATSLQGSYDDVKSQILSELAVSNNNLLINGDFQVNQRGQDTYTKPASSGTFYTFDRWRVYSQASYNSTISKFGNGIRIVNDASGMNFFQLVEMDWAQLLGKKVTMSAKINGEISSVTAQLPSIMPTEQNTNFKTMQKNGYALRIEIRVSNNISYLCAGLYCGASTLDIEYIKLEFGDKATPFVSRNYAEELSLCQRYFQVLEGYRVGMCSPRTDNQIRGCMQYIAKMRARPTVTQLQTLDMYNLTKSRLESQAEINIAPVFTARESTAMVALGSYENLELGDILIPNSAEASFALDAEIY